MMLKTELKHVTLTLRPHKQKDVISKQQRDLLTELKNNKDVTIKKADKSGHVVIIKTTDYQHKINNILSDTTKLIKVKKDATEQFKIKVNSLIETLHMTMSHPNLFINKLGILDLPTSTGIPKYTKTLRTRSLDRSYRKSLHQHLITLNT